jgi:signal transduction histidine kinase
MEVQVVILFVVAAVNSILSLFILLGTRNLQNLIYSIFVLFVSLWAIGLAFFLIETDLDSARSIANFYYIAAAAIPVTFLYFSFSFLSPSFRFTYWHGLILAPFLILAAILTFDQTFLISDIFYTTAGKDVVLNHTTYLIYSTYFVVFVAACYLQLFRLFIRRRDPIERLQLKFIIIGTIIAFFLGMVFNLFFPFIGNYSYIWLGPLFTLIMVVSVGYAVARHHLFNIKVIATEILTFLLWAFIFVRTVIAETPREQLINGGLLFITIIFGIFLIRSVIKEVRIREQIERLAVDLEKSNKELEAANSRLKELDQLKSEFVSLATHQIRGPLTAIKGYASLILEGDFGRVAKPVSDAVKSILDSTQSLVLVVGDFLDVSRIEQGRMKYDLKLFDLKNLVLSVVRELKPNIEKAGLKLNMRINDRDHYHVKADELKLKQVIANLIDNSVKYTPHGSITIALDRRGRNIRFSVEDTGVGISKDTLPKLFQKFTRAKDANEVNILGTGLGLYLARELIQAQGGSIWAESDGPEKGSTFIFELKAER